MGFIKNIIKAVTGKKKLKRVTAKKIARKIGSRIIGRIIPVPRRIRRAIGRIYSFGLARLGMGVRKIADRMIKAGISYAEPTMTNDISTAVSEIEKEYDLIGRAKDSLAGPGDFVEMKLRRMRKYRVIADVDIFDLESGTLTSRTISFYSDNLETFGEFENQYRDFFDKKYKYAGVELRGMRIRIIQHYQGKLY